jgi:hypothetical protein
MLEYIRVKFAANLNAQDINGVSVLHAAYLAHNPDAVNETDRNDRTQVIHYLIEGAKVDLNIQDKKEGALAHYEAKSGTSAKLEYLRSNGADLSAMNSKGVSVFQTAYLAHNPDAADEADRNDRTLVIQYLINRNVPLASPSSVATSSIFTRTPIFRDELTVTNAAGKSVAEVADTKGQTKLVGFFRQTMANRINTAVNNLCSRLFIEVSENNAKYLGPLITEKPEEAIKLAQTCLGTLNNYLPFLMGSIFNSSARAYSNIKDHKKMFPQGMVHDPKSKKQIVGITADAGLAVLEVFKVIEMHGETNGIPINYSLLGTTSLSLQTDEHDEKTILSSSGASNVSTDMVIEEEDQILTIVPQEVLEMHRQCVNVVFLDVFKVFWNWLSGDNKTAVDADMLSNLYFNAITDRDIYRQNQGMNGYTMKQFNSFYTQLKTDAKAMYEKHKGKLDEMKEHKEMLSYSLLVKMHELFTGVQISWDKKNTNQGWCKRLQLERESNKDGTGFMAAMSSSLSLVFSRSKKEDPNEVIR